MLASLRLVSLLIGSVAAVAPAQTYAFDKLTPGTLGQPLDFAFNGAPINAAMLFMLSTNAGPTPLSLVSPGDPRALSVGLEASALWFVVPSGAGAGVLGIPLPNAPALHAALFHFQTATAPGNPFLLGAISNPVVAQLGVAGRSAVLPSQLNIARAFGSILHSGTGDLLYAGGGQGSILSASGLNSSELYDFRTMTVRAGPQLVRSRALGSAIELSDGRVLFAGGVDDYLNPLASCEIYDPQANTFTVTGTMWIPRAAHAAARLAGDKVLVVGGTTSFANPLIALSGTQSAAEIWDPATGLWSTVASMAKRRLAPSLDVLIDGTILVSGGFEVFSVFGAPVPVGAVRSCEFYDSAQDSWSPAPSMNQPRAVHLLNTVQLVGGALLVTGGVQSGPVLTNATAIADCEKYDWINKQWVTVPSMTDARALHTATLLPNGRVIIAGGAQGTLTSPIAIDGVEEYDRVGNSWRARSRLNTTRAAHGAQVTPDGLLVLLGGQGGASELSLPSVETIHP